MGANILKSLTYCGIKSIDCPLISVTLDSGRGKRRLLRRRAVGFPRRASSEDKGQRILEGLLQGTQVLGASTASLSNSWLRKTLQGFYKGAYTQE